jgi:hypothetical protein
MSDFCLFTNNRLRDVQKLVQQHFAEENNKYNVPLGETVVGKVKFFHFSKTCTTCRQELYMQEMFLVERQPQVNYRFLSTFKISHSNVQKVHNGIYLANDTPQKLANPNREVLFGMITPVTLFHFIFRKRHGA